VARPRGVPQEKVLAEISPKIVEMDEIIARCEKGIRTAPRTLDHPILGPLNGASGGSFTSVHGRHHVKQISAVIRGAAQPKAGCHYPKN